MRLCLVPECLGARPITGARTAPEPSVPPSLRPSVPPSLRPSARHPVIPSSRHPVKQRLGRLTPRGGANGGGARWGPQVQDPRRHRQARKKCSPTSAMWTPAPTFCTKHPPIEFLNPVLERLHDTIDTGSTRIQHLRSRCSWDVPQTFVRGTWVAAPQVHPCRTASTEPPAILLWQPSSWRPRHNHKPAKLAHLGPI